MIKIPNLIYSGLLVLLVGSIVAFIVGFLMPNINLPEVCKEWNKYHAMEISLFLTGVFSYIVLELYKKYFKKNNKNNKNNKNK
jgi:uncharacterized membrane protein YgaE (UPF0421/DUF939 family)